MCRYLTLALSAACVAKAEDVVGKRKLRSATIPAASTLGLEYFSGFLEDTFVLIEWATTELQVALMMAIENHHRTTIIVVAWRYGAVCW